MGRSMVGGFWLWVMAMGGLSFMGCGLWQWVGSDGDGRISGGGWVGW